MQAHSASAAASRLIWGAAMVPAVVGVPLSYAVLGSSELGAPLWLAVSWQVLALCYWFSLSILGVPSALARGRSEDIAIPRLTGIVVGVHLGHVAAVVLATQVLHLGTMAKTPIELAALASAICLPLDLLALAAMGIAAAVVDSARLRVGLEANVAESRRRALRAQLEPHFLYNALNSAAVLARRGDGREAAHVLSELGELLRYVLAGPVDSAREDVELGAELDFVSRYLDIERVRFGDRATFVIDASPEVRRALVPVLVLQPLVENAIKHAIAHRESGGGSLIVTARAHMGRLHLAVHDNGADGSARLTAASTQLADGRGLRLTRERLRLRYGAAAQLEVVADANGTRSSVVLPLQYA